MRAILLVGGAPCVPVDAVRNMVARASGTTAMKIAKLLRDQGHQQVELLLSEDASPQTLAERYRSRADLDRALRRWIEKNPEGAVVMSAAVNDYDVDQVSAFKDGIQQDFSIADKVPSGAEVVTITLRPAAKLIDGLRAWGLRGPIIGFKYEAAETVIASAESLRVRVGATLVIANSICGRIQALVHDDGIVRFEQRSLLLDDVASRLALL